MSRFFLLGLLSLFFVVGCATQNHRTKFAAGFSILPPITAKSWAIADGRTGELLWSFKADEPRKSASTTKITCAYVILELAAREPSVLDEMVTFSKLADKTYGSTADVKAGEKLRVRDCLYGLLLPSGNDAGNALAEHFNNRFAPPDERSRKLGLGNSNLTTRVNFIAEMNRTAQRLGLTNTIYRLPFGDGGTPQDRTTTTRDLTRLAWHAMNNPLFRKYVSTQHHKCQVQMPDGKTRTAVWTNTNKLLGINAGFDGVKTGTTKQAGACLVSSGWRGKDHLFVAVLGSTSSDGRYVDTRNLYDWAWQQRGR